MEAVGPRGVFAATAVFPLVASLAALLVVEERVDAGLKDRPGAPHSLHSCYMQYQGSDQAAEHSGRCDASPQDPAEGLLGLASAQHILELTPGVPSQLHAWGLGIFSGTRVLLSTLCLVHAPEQAFQMWGRNLRYRGGATTMLSCSCHQHGPLTRHNLKNYHMQACTCMCSGPPCSPPCSCMAGQRVHMHQQMHDSPDPGMPDPKECCLHRPTSPNPQPCLEV